jgi:DNA modification methylase
VISRNLLSRLSSIDWDFAGTQSESPFSAIHFHPCRFASQVPATLIGLLSKPGDLILDPFVGSGTTLVEAQRLGRESFGIELNPIAVIASKAKTLNSPATVISSLICTLKYEAGVYVGRQMSTVKGRVEPSIPNSVQIEKWYTPQVAEDLGRLWAFLRNLEGDVRIIAEAAFSAVLLPVCRETRHWGYVCDNTTPKNDHEGNVLGEFSRVLDRLDRAYRDRDAEIAASGKAADPIKVATIHAGAAAGILIGQPRSSVDLVVTSPPYFGVCDYIKAQRLSMEWFAINIEDLRLVEIGARSKRHRGKALTEYLDELRTVFTALHRCMKKEAAMAVILGESARRASVLADLRLVLKDAGFTVRLEINRNVSTQRRMAPSITGEYLFILCK